MNKPPFSVSNSMLQKIISITEKISKISVFDSLEKMPILRRNNKISSIHSSLAIEANSLSLEQVRDVINGKMVIGPKKEIQEVKNAFEAYEMMNDFDGYSQKDLIKAHGILTKFFNDDNDTYRNHGEGVFDGEEVIFMAPPENMVPKLMDDLFEWLKGDLETPILIKSCVFHYEFLFVHPFSDGNGRTARLWQNILLMKWNKLFEFLPIESQMMKYQEAYYSAIKESNSKGNSNTFVEFMLGIIDESLTEVISSSQKEARNISDNVNKLLDVMDYDVPISANELLRRLKIKTKETLRNSYLYPALKNGLIKMTIPDKPNSKNQKYYK